MPGLIHGSGLRVARKCNNINKVIGVFFGLKVSYNKSLVNNFTSLSCQLIAVSLQLENKIYY